MCTRIYFDSSNSLSLYQSEEILKFKRYQDLELIKGQNKTMRALKDVEFYLLVVLFSIEIAYFINFVLVEEDVVKDAFNLLHGFLNEAQSLLDPSNWCSCSKIEKDATCMNDLYAYYNKQNVSK